MKIPLFQVDAFTGKVFGGNPAAVCPLKKWLDDSVMQSIAQENNLSETAFFVREERGYRIRWFTPVAEVDLCGHATLASAVVIFNYLNRSVKEVSFDSNSGVLKVAQGNDGLLSMDFPSLPPKPCTPPDALLKGLGMEPVETLCSEDYMAVFAEPGDVVGLKPDMMMLRTLDLRGVTAKGKDVDFISRFFAPKYGIPEDPVTGSAHSTLIPYWAKHLGKSKLHAHQLSQRGGELFCEDMKKRVKISGNAVLYFKGSIYL
jgi:predicted PhzF superfamily epimerase YddE/YHI9